jgi:O-succinylbenzoate synthase
MEEGREPVWYWHYRMRSVARLNALTARREFDGVLIRTGGGFGCIHPWPELGDPPLTKCLEDLAGVRRWPVVRRALRCAEMDAAAREHDDWMFEDLEVPPSHATVVRAEPGAIESAAALGFTHVKLKAGSDLAAEADFLTQMHAAFPDLRWRLDFNETREATEVAGFWQGLAPALQRQIDFFEDPCPFAEGVWNDLRRNHRGLRLAVDREASPLSDAADIVVIKPAVDEPFLLGDAANDRGQRVVVTSAMDHPLGQTFAAWEAGRLGVFFPGITDICGLQTHHLFEKSAFSERLGAWKPEFQAPEGSGLGFNDLLEELPWRRLG